MIAVGSNVVHKAGDRPLVAERLRQWVEAYAQGRYTDVVQAYRDSDAACAAALAADLEALEAVGWSLALTKQWDAYAVLRSGIASQGPANATVAALIHVLDAWRAIHDARYDASLHSVRSLRATLLDTPTPRLLAQSLKVEGVALFRLGRYAEAEARMQQAIDLFQIVGSPIHVSQCATNLGLILNARGEIRAARDALRRALSTLQAAGGARERVAVASENLAVTAVHLGNVGAARDLYSAALAVFEELELHSETIAAMNGLGHCARLAGEFEAAAQLHARALRIAENGFPRKEGLCREFLGQIAFDMGLHDLASTHYERAMEIAAAIAPDGDLMVEVSWRYAELEATRGNVDAARRHVEQAQRLCAASQDRRELGCVQRAGARVLAASGQFDAARDEFRTAVASLETSGRMFEAAITWLAAADAEQASGRSGRDALEKAREALQPIGESTWLREVEARLEPSSQRQRAANRHPAWSLYGFVTQDRETQAMVEDLPAISGTPFPILLEGESGTGKELLARAVHAAARRSGEFVAINCAAVPRDLFESELFGHRRGAFSGAQGEKPGLLELADGGTLLLDEIGEMPLELQAKLLRVLDDGEVRRVGDVQARRLSVKFVAATNRPLLDAIAAGSFRQDLYHRLAVHSLRIRPLRERPEDIAVLARHILQQNHLESMLPLTAALLAELMVHAWPGNVRELRNELIRRATQNSAVGSNAANERVRVDAGRTLRSTRDNHERQVIRTALAQCAGNVTAAAQQLGLHVTTLRRKMRHLEIEPR